MCHSATMALCGSGPAIWSRVQARVPGMAWFLRGRAGGWIPGGELTEADPFVGPLRGRRRPGHFAALGARPGQADRERVTFDEYAVRMARR